jgi:hypothetical protein
MNSTEGQLEHTANRDQLTARQEIERIFFDTLPEQHGGVITGQGAIPIPDLLFNLGLFCRSGLLVKFILMADLYRRVMHVPGIMLEAGVWWGQNLVLMENCRAIFETMHKQRKIVGFDSFEGYGEGPYKGTGLYNTGIRYKDQLLELLHAQAGANVYGHQPCPHELIAGDVQQTAPAYFRKHRGETVALAILDMGPYTPTRAVLEAIKPRLLPGSIVLLDEFTLDSTPGEAQAWLDVMGNKGYRMERIAIYPSKCIAVME